MIYLITGLFILTDMVSGLIKALKNHEFSSHVMREGLFHKAGSILIIWLAILMDYTGHYLDLGLQASLTVPVCCYICIMEVGSILENIGLINPDLLSDKIKQYFNKL